MTKALFFFAIVAPLLALSLTMRRRGRDWLTKFESDDPETARGQRQAIQAALSGAGHRRFRDNVPYAFAVTAITIPIVWLIDYLT